VFDARDDATLTVPGVSRTIQFSEQPLLLPALLELLFGLLHQRFGPLNQSAVAGQAHDKVHPLAVAPAEHFPAAKSAVAPEDDLHLRPSLAQAFDDQGQNGPGVFGLVDVAGPEIRTE